MISIKKIRFVFFHCLVGSFLHFFPKKTTGLVYGTSYSRLVSYKKIDNNIMPKGILNSVHQKISISAYLKDNFQNSGFYLIDQILTQVNAAAEGEHLC